MVQLAWLLGPNLYDNLFIFSHADRCANEVSPLEVPWYVAWFLTWRSAKFREFPRKLLPWSAIATSIAELKTRMCWKWKHKGSPVLPDEASCRVKRKPIRFPDHMVPPELDAWSKQLRRKMLEAQASCKLQRPVRRRKHPIESTATKWLVDNNWYVLPADKGGGSVLVTLDDLVDAHKELLEDDNLQKVELVEVDVIDAKFYNDCHVKLYCRLTKAISQQAVWSARTVDLNASLCAGHKGLVSKMQSTVKTHKAPGKVKMRPILNKAAYPFSSLGSWLNYVLTPVLGKFAHIASSAEQVLERVSKCVFPPNVVFVHFDLDDFFLKGTLPFLQHHVSLLGPPPVRPLIKKTLDFLLDRQFVTSSTQHFVLKGVCGPGIGHKHSGAVSNAAFLHAVELQGLGLAREAFQKRHKILLYMRYADNFVFVVDSSIPEIESGLLAELGTGLGSYSGQLEEMSGNSLDVLDFQLFKELRFNKTGKMDYRAIL